MSELEQGYTNPQSIVADCKSDGTFEIHEESQFADKAESKGDDKDESQ